MLIERITRNAWAYHSVQALFRETCHTNATRQAIVFRKQAITYQQLLDGVDRLTHALLEAGIGRGDVVSVLPSPTPDFAVVYFAVLQTGAIVNPLNLMWNSDQLSTVLQRNAPRAIVTVRIS